MALIAKTLGVGYLMILTALICGPACAGSGHDIAQYSLSVSKYAKIIQLSKDGKVEDPRALILAVDFVTLDSGNIENILLKPSYHGDFVVITKQTLRGVFYRHGYECTWNTDKRRAQCESTNGFKKILRLSVVRLSPIRPNLRLVTYGLIVAGAGARLPVGDGPEATDIFLTLKRGTSATLILNFVSTAMCFSQPNTDCAG
jgi:hypothetical protein